MNDDAEKLTDDGVLVESNGGFFMLLNKQSEKSSQPVEVDADEARRAQRIIESYLQLEDLDQEISISRLSQWLGPVLGGASTVTALIDRFGTVIRLTPESSAKVKELGYVPTDVNGLFHMMAGKPGTKDMSWLQGEEVNSGPLTAVSIFLDVASRFYTSKQLRKQWEVVNEKNDELIESMRDKEFGKLKTACDEIREANTLLKNGYPQLAMAKVASVDHDAALMKNGALGTLARITGKIHQTKSKADLVAAGNKRVEEKIEFPLLLIELCIMLQDMFENIQIKTNLMDETDVAEFRKSLNKNRHQRMKEIRRLTDALVVAMDDAANSTDEGEVAELKKSADAVAAAVHQFQEKVGVLSTSPRTTLYVPPDQELSVESKEEPKLTQSKPILALGSPAKLAEEYAGLALGGFYGLGIAASVTAVMNVLRTRRK